MRTKEHSNSTTKTAWSLFNCFLFSEVYQYLNRIVTKGSFHAVLF